MCMLLALQTKRPKTHESESAPAILKLWAFSSAAPMLIPGTFGYCAPVDLGNQKILRYHMYQDVRYTRDAQLCAINGKASSWRLAC